MPTDIRYYKREDLPTYWQDETYERAQGWLKDWLAAPDQLGIGVPSVLVPLWYNVIPHPTHALFEQIRVIGQQVQPLRRSDR